MTFTSQKLTSSKALYIGLLILFIAQGALASKQVITCENSVSMVLFGLQSAYGEVFNSGLTNISNDGTSSTIAAQNRLNEDRLPDALFAGSDYDGNTVAIQLPKAIIGKDASSPFSAMAKLILNKSKQERTLEVKCLSQVSE